MLEAIRAFSNLQWRQQPPKFRPLPTRITRTFVPSHGGDLELLTCYPNASDSHAPPVFFAHGGYGSAGVWLDWMTYLHDAGYQGTLYAYSARNHGASYSLPFIRMVLQTSLDNIADDFKTCLSFAQELEAARGRSEHFVLVGHSAGGGLVQYALSRSLVQCQALCLLDAVPHFGVLPVYHNWLKLDPWFPLRMLIHFTPTSPLSTERLVHEAFFGPKFPKYRVRDLMRWMPAYESNGWPTSMMGSFAAWWGGSSRWLDVKDIMINILDLSSVKDSICIMVGSEDKLMDVGMCRRQALEFRDGMRTLQDHQTTNAAKDVRRVESKTAEGVEVESDSGVRLVVVEDAGHHLQNDVQQDVGAEALLRFVQQC